MGIVFAFIVGYAVGAQAGQHGLEQLVASARAVRDSEEFKAFLSALRSHASFTLHDLSIRVADDTDARLALEDLFGRFKEWIAPDPTSGEASSTERGPGAQ